MERTYRVTESRTVEVKVDVPDSFAGPGLAIKAAFELDHSAWETVRVDVGAVTRKSA